MTETDGWGPWLAGPSFTGLGSPPLALPARRRWGLESLLPDGERRGEKQQTPRRGGGEREERGPHSLTPTPTRLLRGESEGYLWSPHPCTGEGGPRPEVLEAPRDPRLKGRDRSSRGRGSECAGGGWGDLRPPLASRASTPRGPRGGGNLVESQESPSVSAPPTPLSKPPPSTTSPRGGGVCGPASTFESLAHPLGPKALGGKTGEMRHARTRPSPSSPACGPVLRRRRGRSEGPGNNGDAGPRGRGSDAVGAGVFSTLAARGLGSYLSRPLDPRPGWLGVRGRGGGGSVHSTRGPRVEGSARLPETGNPSAPLPERWGGGPPQCTQPEETVWTPDTERVAGAGSGDGG